MSDKEKKLHVTMPQMTKMFHICRGAEDCEHISPRPHVHLKGGARFIEVPDTQKEIQLTVLETLIP